MAEQEASRAIGNIILEMTGGRPYIFMIMPYDAAWDFFEHVRDVVERSVGLACIRADQIPASGHDLLTKIHLLTERAELVIAEISEPKPNVFYEVGYAVAADRPILLLIRKGVGVPTDLMGREVIQYGTSREEMQVFDRNLADHLSLRVTSQVAVLRDMLEADIPRPAYIVASPKYPGADSRIRGQVYDKRTFGDNLGVLGLLSAFGSFAGEGTGVELISAQYRPPDLLELPLNLYLIGSGKTNPATDVMLEQLQQEREPNWYFGPRPGEKKEGDWRVRLFRRRGGDAEYVKGEAERHGRERGIVHTVDHGIIVRGPHPEHPGRLVMVLAGAHSLGTGAACLAATRSPLIKQIEEKLPEGVRIAEKDRTIWALARGQVNERDWLLDVEGVSIVEAGVYD